MGGTGLDPLCLGPRGSTVNQFVASGIIGLGMQEIRCVNIMEKWKHMITSNKQQLGLDLRGERQS